ncbi:MAG: acyl-CoA dehydrogenase domain protein [Acidimicrobiales bacterium]|nr:acyl-CoA dehydrogenase domain protein [Acidimicrobiales bacterium]
MDLDFSPEQELLRESVRGVCARHAAPDVVRAMEDDPVGYPAELWRQLGELGLIGLTLPERRGGSEMSMVDAMVVYEELGRSLAPSPHFVSSVMAGGLLVRAGTDEQRSSWLPRVASGEAILSIAWVEPGRGFGPEGVRLRAERDGDGWRLTGTKQHVAFAGSAERLLTLARTDEGVTLFLVDPQGDGVTLTQQRSMASDTQFRLDLDGARVGEGDVVGTVGEGWAPWSHVLQDGLILLAASAAGGAARALEMTVQYSKDRRQFDKPLGAFQALSHYMADAATTVDGAQALVWEAAWARTAGRPVSRLAPMAKLFACQTFRDVTATCQQIYGGMGFTVECDIQLYFRRAKQLQISWCDTRRLEELVAADVLDTERAAAPGVLPTPVPS